MKTSRYRTRFSIFNVAPVTIIFYFRSIMKRLETFQKVSLYRTIKVNVCLMENVHLTKFVESLNSEFKLPSRMTFRNHIIKHFQTKGGNMVNYLKTKPIGDILTTTNLWTSSNNYAVIT